PDEHRGRLRRAPPARPVRRDVPGPTASYAIRARGGAEAVHRRDPPGPTDGVGHPPRWRPALPAGPARRGGGAPAALRHRAPHRDPLGEPGPVLGAPGDRLRPGHVHPDAVRGYWGGAGPAGARLVRLRSRRGALIALARIDAGMLRPVKVLAGAEGGLVAHRPRPG